MYILGDSTWLREEIEISSLSPDRTSRYPLLWEESFQTRGSSCSSLNLHHSFPYAPKSIYILNLIIFKVNERCLFKMSLTCSYFSCLLTVLLRERIHVFLRGKIDSWQNVRFWGFFVFSSESLRFKKCVLCFPMNNQLSDFVRALMLSLISR